MRVGWTAGAGASFAVTGNWAAGIEYRYTDLGTDHWSRPAPIGLQDNNGFTFSAVRLSLTYHFAAPAPPPPALVPHTFLVFFDFDRYDLTPEGRPVIEEAPRSFRTGGYARIELGYTDLAGTQQYNLKLSQRRATVVAEYLDHLGMPRKVMRVKWYGKEHPRVPTRDGVRAPQNRRVEIAMP